MPLLYSSFLNEDVHVSYVFDNALDNIINSIQNQIDNLDSKEYYTKFVYEPGIKEVLFFKDEVQGKKIGYPIYVKAYDNKNIRSTMRVEPSITDRIVIKYNILWIDKIKFNKKIIKEALKHEFLHVVETYLSGKVLSLNESNYDIPKDNIKEFCYLINSSEINARINQAAKRLDNLSDDELNTVINLIKKKFIDKKHPVLLKSLIIEELMKYLEDILQLEYIRKFVVEMIQKYKEPYTQDEIQKRRVNLIQICKFGFYIKKFNIIKRNENNSMMIDWLPDKEDNISIVKSNLSLEELDSISFNVIKLLEWYISYINKRTIESIYDVIENKRNINLV